MTSDEKHENPVRWTVLPAEELTGRATEWNGLNKEFSNLPILDAEFFTRCIRHFGSGKEILVLGHAQTQLRVAGVFVPGKFGSWSTFQPSQAPLGAWISKTAKFGAVLPDLQSALPGMCLLLGVSQQDPTLSTRPTADNRLRTLDYIDTAGVRIEGSFEDYWAQRGRNLRQNMRRQRNRLKRDNVATRLEIVCDPHLIGDAVDDFGNLEFRGWKAKKGTALHPENVQGRFYREIFEAYSKSGEATVYKYWYNDKLAAADLCLHRDGVQIILKTAHDESFSKTSPTHLMRQELFEQLFLDGQVRRIEFYGKLMDWHTKWASDVRRMYHVNCYRWSVFLAMKRIMDRGARTR